MSDNWFHNRNALTPSRGFTAAMLGFAAAFALHSADHLRRGMAASPPAIMVGGMIQGVIVAVTVALVLRHHRWAVPVATVVGFGSAALFVYAHVLPTFAPGLQDSFTSGPRINVTWFSWLTAVAEIGAGLILGCTGLRARHSTADGTAAHLPKVD